MPELKLLDFPAKAPKKEKKRRKYEQADGTFKAKPMINGKRHTVRGKSTKEVEEKIAELKRELKGGADPALRNITVEEWSKRWIKTEITSESKRYVQGIQHQIDLINKKIGSMKVRDVRLIHLNSIMNSRKDISRSQITKMHQTIKRMFRFARQNEIIQSDPSESLKKPQGTYKGHRCLTPEEINLLMNNWQCCRAGIWAVTMMLAGIRVGECLALKQKDFLFDKGVIQIHDAVEMDGNNYVLRGKTKTSAGMREAPLLEPLASIIKKDFEENPRDSFIVRADGSPITASSFNAQWKAMLRALTNINAGYPADKVMPRDKDKKAEYQERIEKHRVKFDRHDLRHTFATFLFEAEVDEKTSMRYLGHTSPQMTRDLYAHLRAEQMRKSEEKLNDYFNRFQSPETDPT